MPIKKNLPIGVVKVCISIVSDIIGVEAKGSDGLVNMLLILGGKSSIVVYVTFSFDSIGLIVGNFSYSGTYDGAKIVVNDIGGCSVEIIFDWSVVFQLVSVVNNSIVEFNSGIFVAYDDSVDDVNGYEEEANDDTSSVLLISLDTVVSSSSSEITETLSVVTEISSLIVVFVGI